MGFNSAFKGLKTLRKLKIRSLKRRNDWQIKNWKGSRKTTAVAYLKCPSSISAKGQRKLKNTSVRSTSRSAFEPDTPEPKFEELRFTESTRLTALTRA